MLLLGGTTQTDSGSDYKYTEFYDLAICQRGWLEDVIFPTVSLHLCAEELLWFSPKSIKVLRVHFFYYHCILKKLWGTPRLPRLQIEELRLQEETGCSVCLLELPVVPPRWHPAETALLSRLWTQWNDGDGTAGLQRWFILEDSGWETGTKISIQTST